MKDELFHYGIGHEEDPPGRGSGRFAWGSGENPYQHQFDFISEVTRLDKKGFSEREIATLLLGPKKTSSDLRAALSIAKAQVRKGKVERAQRIYDETGSYSETGRRMGINESSVRKLLDPVLKERTDRYQSTADMLRKIIDEKKYVDLSSGTELYLGITQTTKETAMKILESEGYIRSWVKIPQAGTSNETTILVMSPPGTTHSDIQKNKYNVEAIQEFTPDAGKTWWTPEKPVSVDSKRILIRYAEEGGKLKDGVVELRQGVEDISLGDSRYAQVRIAVDDKYYMKGMAIYGDIPAGYDIVYNTNKSIGTPPEKVFKELKVSAVTGEVDWDNPFGATIKAGGQRKYTDSEGNTQLSPINKLQEEGDWDSWSRTLSSQFLSKQPEKLIKQQLSLSTSDKRLELDEIKRLTNPAIKKKLLDEYADECDANAADLSAKGFKHQSFQVLLPVPSLKDNEIYAPNYSNGDTVALVRFPHGGPFETPILTVNNKQKDARRTLGNAKDAVGINSNVAEVLSGADFDGDTAVVIPVKSNNLNVLSIPPLEQLKGFDGKALYKMKDSDPKINPQTKQIEMGKVTNLITDMTVAGAENDEIARAVKHSMVVIDSEKHHLDYKQSFQDNDIANLKVKYQGSSNAGASTILSRASASIEIDERKELTDTSKMTPEQLERWNRGDKVYISTGKTSREQVKNPSNMTPEELEIYNSGKKVYRDTQKPKQMKVATMDTVDDAMTLVRDPSNKKEVYYAQYANSLKDMAREARRESRSIKPVPVNPTAREVYAQEVKDLGAKLKVAKMNAPKERKAQIYAHELYSDMLKSNPNMDHEHKKRAQAVALTKARAAVGAKKETITITDREWQAIQSHALSTNRVTEILNNSNPDDFKKRATPRQSETTLTNAQRSLIRSMMASGMYTQKEIADRLGVSVSTVNNEAA